MKEKQVGYAQRVFGSTASLQAKLCGVIRHKIDKRRISYAELDELCSFGRALPGNLNVLPKTEEFLRDSSKITELVWTLVCHPLGLCLDDIKVKLDAETYEHALNEMNSRALGQGPPGTSEAVSVKIFVLMRALQEIS